MRIMVGIVDVFRTFCVFLAEKAVGVVCIAGFLLSGAMAMAGTIYVDASVASSGVGTNWLTAKKTIQEGRGCGDQWMYRSCDRWGV